ncbi:MAG TPA: CoA-binding protein [Methanomicrobia archaeon]|nr:CoA-binding protein [Methanomicrobia archaeon]HEX59747.1 CoA-binding protein [Methanomicrobia archaeon]
MVSAVERGGEAEAEPESDLSYFFEPRSVAIIGALREGWFGGYVIIKNLRLFGFPGEIYPVNPRYDKVLGLDVYASIKDVPATVDLVIIITPAATVPGILEECGDASVRAAIVVSDGFAERSEEGAKLQEELVGIGRREGVRILGPNTVGVTNTANGLVTTPYEFGYSSIRRGYVALAGQTGIIAPQAVPYEDLQYGVSKICDFGNKCDVDETDLLEYLAEDAETKVIAMYLEGIKDGRRFLATAKRVVKRKPVIVLKSGRSEEGARVASSHTGTLAGDDRIYEAAFRQVGVLRVRNFRELFEIPKIFGQPRPKGNRIAIITMTGGAGVMSTDVAYECSLELARFSEKTIGELEKIFPSLAKNPSDVGPAMFAGDLVQIYKKTIEAALEDENVDCVSVVLWTGEAAPPQLYVELFNELKEKASKPIAIWIYGTKVTAVHELSRELEKLDFPVFLDFETAVRALGMLCEYSRLQGDA